MFNIFIFSWIGLVAVIIILAILMSMVEIIQDIKSNKNKLNYLNNLKQIYKHNEKNNITTKLQNYEEKYNKSNNTKKPYSDLEKELYEMQTNLNEIRKKRLELEEQLAQLQSQTQQKEYNNIFKNLINWLFPKCNYCNKRYIRWLFKLHYKNINICKKCSVIYDIDSIEKFKFVNEIRNEVKKNLILTNSTN